MGRVARAAHAAAVQRAARHLRHMRAIVPAGPDLRRDVRGALPPYVFVTFGQVRAADDALSDARQRARLRAAGHPGASS
jgi:hypothetical protein